MLITQIIPSLPCSWAREELAEIFFGTGDGGPILPSWLQNTFLSPRLCPEATMPGQAPGVRFSEQIQFHDPAGMVVFFQDTALGCCGCLLTGLFHFHHVSPVPGFLSGPQRQVEPGQVRQHHRQRQPVGGPARALSQASAFVTQGEQSSLLSSISSPTT